MFWKPAVAVQADVASFLLKLQAALSRYQCDAEWPGTLKHRDAETERANE